MKFQLTDSWENVSDQQRLAMVFDGRNHLYGAYIIRQHYNRNKVLAMILAPLFIAALSASFWIKIQDNTDPLASPPIRIQKYFGEIIESEPELQPAAQKQTPKKENADQVPDIDPKSPERNSNVLPPSGGAWDPDGLPGGKGDRGTTGSADTTGLGGGNGKSSVDGIIRLPDSDAVFVGGDEKFKEFIITTFNTPRECLESEAIGEVKLMFVVSEAGTLSNFRVLESSASCPEFADEAIRVLKASPRWVPAIHKGKFTKAWRVATIRLQY